VVATQCAEHGHFPNHPMVSEVVEATIHDNNITFDFGKPMPAVTFEGAVVI